MRLMRQFGIIAGMTCVGELMHYFIPLPVPGSIYGLALMMIDRDDKAGECARDLAVSD